MKNPESNITVKMKKILRGPVKYRIKCHYCDCEFEYQYEDIIRDSGFSPFTYVKCPSCGYSLLHEDSGSCTSATLNNVDTMKL